MKYKVLYLYATQEKSAFHVGVLMMSSGGCQPGEKEAALWFGGRGYCCISCQMAAG